MKERHDAYRWMILVIGFAMAIASAARFIGLW
jgi:hypothetical protein